eukprot:TRINITY_DN3255_c0_g3_i2.p1 TRINITY_DN3255_c0_g3~~TRINITY_DN3255_c0_g3_i2.p1  ORF type:complete len:193 (+),score=34.29 TRINITY_DN3255_c0_g3_i2:169-747(+)
MEFAESRHRAVYINEINDELAAVCNQVLVEVSHCIAATEGEGDLHLQLKPLTHGGVTLQPTTSETPILTTLPWTSVSKVVKQRVLQSRCLPDASSALYEGAWSRGARSYSYSGHYENFSFATAYRMDEVSQMLDDDIPERTISRHLKSLGWSLDVNYMGSDKVTVTLSEQVLSRVSLHACGLQLLEEKLQDA